MDQPNSASTNNPARPSDSFQTHPSLVSLHSPLESRRREGDAHRNIMEIHRESLRAAERTISLLREQIRLHDERVRLTISSVVPSPASVGRPTRTPTQRAALQRSLSTRLATVQDDLRREQLIQQLSAASLGLLRRTAADGSLEEDTLLTTPSRRSSLRLSDQQELILNSCPILTDPTVTPTRANYPIHGSSDLWIRGGRRENLLSSASASRRQFSNQEDQDSNLTSGTYSNQQVLEHEWERQLADGEVDTNGVPIPQVDRNIHPFNSPQLVKSHCSSSRFTSTHLGTRKVDGLGLQLASNSSNSHYSNSLSSSAGHSFHPLCLR